MAMNKMALIAKRVKMQYQIYNMPVAFHQRYSRAQVEALKQLLPGWEITTKTYGWTDFEPPDLVADRLEVLP